jgi:hypothetical protein
MAVNSRRIWPIQNAKLRRVELSRYLALDGSRYLLGAVLILCLVSLIALGQTGLVATRGYAIAQLETQRTDLLRERTQLQLRLAAARSLDTIEHRARDLGLRPITRDQTRYISIPEQPVTHALTP